MKLVRYVSLILLMVASPTLLASVPVFMGTDGDLGMVGQTNLEEVQESSSATTATQYLQTTSTSANITSIHIVNTSSVAQSFTGTLYNRDGERLGSAGAALSSADTAAKGRLILSSDDLETLFAVTPWSGPAMLEVTGTDTFELMAKLISPSGLVSNTNCVRQDRVLNIEGFNSENLTFVRFINTTDAALGVIKGTLYDANGVAIGTNDTTLLTSLAPKQAVWITGEDLARLIGDDWENEAMLEVDIIAGLKLLNLNLVNGETFFNFSCFESSESGRVYIQTTSSSNNESFTHLVNTSNSAQAFTGTLYNRVGDQLGSASQPLHIGTVPPKGRMILSSGEIETAFSTSPWTGPAIVEVQGTGTFEVMTKLTSPSGLISNTNCVRSNQVHNVEPPGSSDKTFVRVINTGSTTLSDIKGSLYDGVGNIIGSASQTLASSLPAKSAIWLTRDNISDIVGDTWNGAALLEVESPPAELRLLNLNLINSETFFNFSCYEASDSAVPSQAEASAYYASGELVSNNAISTWFDRSLDVYGIRLLIAGNVGGQPAVPDEWAKKTAQAFKLLMDPNAPGINLIAQERMIKTLLGEVGWHSGFPTGQRIGYGSGSSYSPNPLSDEGGLSYEGLDELNDSMSLDDMVWYKNVGSRSTGDEDIVEMIEHVLHTLHRFGVRGAITGSTEALNMEVEESDITRTALYLAMREAVENGVFGIEDYGGDINDENALPVMLKEYQYLLTFGMWEYGEEFWENGSLSPEWNDNARTPEGVKATNPLGYELFNTYFDPVVSKPSVQTLRLIFQDNDQGVSGYEPD